MTSSSKAPRRGPGGAGTARAATPYSRFIPREELGSFAAWSPDTLNPERDAAPPAEAARAPQAHGAAAPAEAGAPSAQLAAARQAGYQDGYRDGLVGLDNFKQSFAVQLSAQLGELLRSFDTQIAALEQQMAQALARAAVQLARRVVRAELQSHPEQVAHAAAQALAAVLQSARRIRVLVHPDDHALVAAGAAEALHARGAQLVAQPGIERGGCLVESDLGQVDARIAARWQQAAAVLGSELRWHDGGGEAAR
ncbi:MAG TPA: FliH/SctL family protein [Rubrivivax sp.]|nr:FliH/SctL family protein [Rubrivivax sp.]